MKNFSGVRHRYVLIALIAGSVGVAQDQIGRLRGILERSLPPEESVSARDEAARERALAAIALLRLGRSDPVWPVLRASADNSARSYLIQYLGSNGVDPGILVQHLTVESDASIRRALILSLGAFKREQILAADPPTLTLKFLEWYRTDADAGIHSAIDWLLRNDGGQQIDAVTSINDELAGKPSADRYWYATGQGQTIAILRGPVEFQMGAPAYEAGRMPGPDSPDEPVRHVRIPRSFAIATKEVTVGEFQRFLNENPEVKAQFTYPGDPTRMVRVLQNFSPDDDGPIIAVTWYEAAMYCNWLSKQEGLPESEWVYPTDFAEIRDGMKLPEDYLHRTGYRLPTEAEWEYAARAGSHTSRFFGSSIELLDEYAWYSRNPPRTKSDPIDPADPQRTRPVGRLKPNDFGLFDVYGNVWEWTMDRMQESFPSVMDDSEDIVLAVSDLHARSRRGGAFPYGAAYQRSANRDTRNAFPNLRRDNVGFRVARTIR